LTAGGQENFGIFLNLGGSDLQTLDAEITQFDARRIYVLRKRKQNFVIRQRLAGEQAKCAYGICDREAMKEIGGEFRIGRALGVAAEICADDYAIEKFGSLRDQIFENDLFPIAADGRGDLREIWRKGYVTHQSARDKIGEFQFDRGRTQSFRTEKFHPAAFSGIQIFYLIGE